MLHGNYQRAKNICNSNCIMCGLSYADNKKVAEISLENYKLMLGNLDMNKVKEITFSGGGDPLLCNDLTDIIDYTGQTYPKVSLFIYTNGIALTEEVSKKIMQHNFCRIVISVNASSAETYRKIMRVDAFEKVVSNIQQLVAIRNHCDKKLKIHLSFVASMLNIKDLPGMITLGSDVGVDEIGMLYCRFYSKRFSPESKHSDKVINRKHSLFFHQDYSDKIVKEAESIAREKQIEFLHDPLFCGTPTKKQCIWPWTVVIIDPLGEVYPCGGGEVMFYKPVSNKTLYFGNILQEHISKSWNNDDYKKLRKSCNYHNRNKSVAQCYNCNHTWRWEGINNERSHFIDIDISGKRP